MLKRFAFAVFAVAALSANAAARDLTDDDWAALEEQVTAQEMALHSKDAGAVIDAFPPAILPLIAQMSGGVTNDVARQQGIDAMMAQAEGASFDAFDIDYENAQGPYELSDGTTYVLMPTKMIDLPGDGSKLKDEVTVAVLIDEQWYLMGFGTDQELQLLSAAYPGFAEPDFKTNFAAALGGGEQVAEADTAAAENPAALDDEQRAGLEARVAEFNTAMENNDIAGIMGIIPPVMLEKMAAQFNVTTDEVIAATQAQMDEIMKTVTFVSFSMDLETMTIAAQADGTPYVKIPTETVMDLGAASGGKVRARSETLGVLDNGTWYLIRVDDPQQVAMIKGIYPGLADVEFKPGSMEPVTE